MASLIHAYNGFTRDRVLSRYPDLKSIRDPGSLLSSPWKKPFFTRLGAQRTLDGVSTSRCGCVITMSAFTSP